MKLTKIQRLLLLLRLLLQVIHTEQNKKKEEPNQNNDKANTASIVYTDAQDTPLVIDTTTKIVSDGQNWKFQALDEKGTSLNIIITKEVATSMGGNFGLLKDACEATFKNKNHTHLNILCKKGTYNNYNVLFLTGIN